MNTIKVKKTFASRHPLALIAAGVVAMAVAVPGAARAESAVIPQTVLELLGVVKLRQMCYDRCSADLDKAAKKCDKKYPLLSPDWSECMGDALAVYLNCTEACPPKAVIIDNPFGQ